MIGWLAGLIRVGLCVSPSQIHSFADRGQRLPYLSSPLAVRPPPHCCRLILLHPLPSLRLPALLVPPTTATTHNLSPLFSPNNILPSLSRFYSSAHILPTRHPLFLACGVFIWHVRGFPISWSSGDSSRSPCLRSCYDQMRGTGHAGAACWQQ